MSITRDSSILIRPPAILRIPTTIHILRGKFPRCGDEHREPDRLRDGHAAPDAERGDIICHSSMSLRASLFT